jgi:hypothetical protein
VCTEADVDVEDDKVLIIEEVLDATLDDGRTTVEGPGGATSPTSMVGVAANRQPDMFLRR